MAQPYVKIDKRGENTVIELRESRGKFTVPAGTTVLVNPTTEELKAGVHSLLVEARVRNGVQGRLIDA